jgi:hypothetical protein
MIAGNIFNGECLFDACEAFSAYLRGSFRATVSTVGVGLTF